MRALGRFSALMVLLVAMARSDLAYADTSNPCLGAGFEKSVSSSDAPKIKMSKDAAAYVVRHVNNACRSLGEAARQGGPLEQVSPALAPLMVDLHTRWRQQRTEMIRLVGLVQGALCAFGRSETQFRTKAGGGSGIRTHVTVSRKHAFQACAFSHSATPPDPPVFAPPCAAAPGRYGKRAGTIATVRRDTTCAAPPVLPVKPPQQ